MQASFAIDSHCQDFKSILTIIRQICPLGTGFDELDLELDAEIFRSTGLKGLGLLPLGIMTAPNFSPTLGSCPSML